MWLGKTDLILAQSSACHHQHMVTLKIAGVVWSVPQSEERVQVEISTGDVSWARTGTCT